MAGSTNIEIERKFLLASDAWRREVTASRPITQVYLASTAVSQVRLRRYGAAAFITVKGRRKGLARPEIEAEIPPEFVDAVLAAGLSPVPPLVKVRHLVPVGAFCFEIDEYGGDNEGLVTAEVELPTEDADFPRPGWLGADVSGDVRYGNVYLTQRPYKSW
ncbi:CYTH domain-containing protein [Micromonospora sp. NPDC000663]|uniref:CYTH domain-containing protein n=1 Tax=Micromonospora sp. NPDC000663 TaxID=3364218 RepID=UPI0036A6016D